MTHFIVHDGILKEQVTGNPHALSCRDAVVGHGLRQYVVEHLRNYGLGQRLLLVCDPETRAALGDFLLEKLQGFYQIEVHQLSSQAKPHIEIARHISERLKTMDVLIAVGSGVINDLCKYAASVTAKPYIVWATALSMNGYLSANASIIRDGIKMSLPAQMPLAAFVDLEICAAAPLRLTQSGLGDAICRTTAQADWLLSHLLLETPYDETPYQLLAPYEEGLLENAYDLSQGSAAHLFPLAATLLVSGIGMTLSGGSYPASQGEHMLAHTLEMKHGESGHYHGEEIAVTTLTMARLQDDLLNKVTIQPKISEDALVMLQTYFDEARAETLHQDYSKKQGLVEACKRWNEWTEIATQVNRARKPTPQLELALSQAGLALQPEALGWSHNDYEKAKRLAPLTRSRFTFLDLVSG